MVKALHDAGIEVILDVVYNHTAEGNHRGPDAVLQGPRQPRLLPPRRRRPALLLRHDGHRQQPQHAPPARAAADHGLAALLGDRDARRRLPLRPRRHARAPVPRGRPAVGVLRPHPAGPGRQPGQADRRAVGHRRGRLPGRQLPAAVVGVERQVPRHDPRLLARRGPDARRVRLARRPGSSDLYQADGRRPTASINFVTAHDGFTLADLTAYNEKHNDGQRRGRRRRRVAQPLVELRRRGADRRPRDQRAARPPAAQLHRHAACSPRASRCCSAATSWAAPRAATTTPTARTTRSPGSTGTRIDGELLAFTQRVIDFRKGHPVFRRRRFSTADEMAGSAPTARR